MPASLERLFRKTTGNLSSRYLYSHPNAPDGQADYPRIANVERLGADEKNDPRLHSTSNPGGINIPDMVVSVLCNCNIKTLEAFLDTKSPAVKYNHYEVFSQLFIERTGSTIRVRRV